MTDYELVTLIEDGFYDFIPELEERALRFGIAIDLDEPIIPQAHAYFALTEE